MDRSPRNLWLLWASLGYGVYTLLAISVFLPSDLDDAVIFLAVSTVLVLMTSSLYVPLLLASVGRLHWMAILGFMMWILLLSYIQLSVCLRLSEMIS